MANIKKTVRKAQRGDKLKPDFYFDASKKTKRSYESSKTPKYTWKVTSPSGRAQVTNSADTTGYAAGRKNFSGKSTIIDRKGEKKFSPSYFTMNRDAVTTALQKGFHKKPQRIGKTGDKPVKRKSGGKITKAKSAVKMVRKSVKKK